MDTDSEKEISHSRLEVILKNLVYNFFKLKIDTQMKLNNSQL